MKLEVRSTGSLSTAEQSYIADWAYKIFEGQDLGLEWANGDWQVLVWEGDELASMVEIVERTGKVGEKPVKLAGIGGVATWPAFRKRGLATTAMQKAMDFISAQLDAEFGLLVCDIEKIPFYGRLGWQVVDESLLVIEQPGGKMDFPSIVMVWPCHEGKEWPAGKIDLCGPPW